MGLPGSLAAREDLRHEPAGHCIHQGAGLAGKRQAITIRFTKDDLAQVRFGAGPAPLIETVLGFAELRRQPNGFPASRWASRARRVVPQTARPLLDLVAECGTAPGFMDSLAPEMDEALEAVCATPKTVLRDELAGSCHVPKRPPAWLRALAEGDQEALRTLTRALRDFYSACVAPYWPGVVTSFRGDITDRMAVLAQGGLGEVFDTLHRKLAWREGALELAAPGMHEFRLDGNGLQILPSALWTGRPLLARSPHTSGVSAVIYAVRQATVGAREAGQPTALAALIGRTRAAVLETLRTPSSTADLAARVGISAPSASEHAAVLRDADLIQTVRCGRGVSHSLTPLGRSLLGGY